MKRWQIIKKFQKSKTLKLKTEEIIKTLLKNRALKTKKQVEEFLNPPNPYTLGARSLAIPQRELTKSVKRIKKAIDEQESIIVYSDFDADGICGAAILWETLNSLGAKAMPYIPDRIKEGYGLSKNGIDTVLKDYGASLIITVDQGITAKKEVEYARKKNIEVIVTDHHVLPKKLPKALATVHTTSLSGAGVAWFLAQNLSHLRGGVSGVTPPRWRSNDFDSSDGGTKRRDSSDHLALVAIGSIADLIPLSGPNRSLVKYGLEELNKTKRIGLRALFKEAGLEKGKIDTYHVGFIIAPRLNAMGRIEHGIDSLRLLCTKDPARASSLAQKLGQTNRERQKLMEQTTIHAKELLKDIKGQPLKTKRTVLGKERLIFLADKSYHEGIIGLVAGKLVEKFYRPSIVVSQGQEFSKASARSINGFNIVEAIRSCADLLVDCGGHPMAAGFTVKSKYLDQVKDRLEELAAKEISQEQLTKTLKIDCEISLSDVTFKLYQEMAKFAPFGIGNPQPVFATRGVVVQDARVVGRDKKHLKLTIKTPGVKSEPRDFASFTSEVKSLDTSEVFPAGEELATLSAIAFNQGDLYPNLSPDKPIDIAYNIILDEWNNQKTLQLKIKDIKLL